jgi:hypothetical protein
MIVLLAGCPGGITIPLPPSIFSPSVTTPAGSLRLNESGDVTVSAVVTAARGAVVGVTADLTALGGPGAVPMALSTVPNTWSTTVSVLPAAAGLQEVAITAVSSSGLSSQATATINVIGGVNGTSLPPVVSPPAVTGTLRATFASTILVTVVATDPDGTVQSVVADLSPIGGLSAQPLFESLQTPDLWTFSGVVTPPTIGTMTIFIEATDDFGQSTTVSTAVVVDSPVQ